MWAALPEAMRGTFYSPSHTEAWGTPLDRHRDRSRHVLVAAWSDAQKVGPSPLVYLEHGAGQSYDGDPRSLGNGSYSGGVGLDRVRLFLAPSQHVADRWRSAYQDTRIAVIGCPKLDRWHGGLQQDDDQKDDADDEGQHSYRASVHASDGTPQPVVAVTFHWECPLVPETRTAWHHYDDALPGLAADPRWQLLGHGHPRLWGAIRRRWQQLSVEATPDLADVLDRADLLVADNTSAMMEFASLDKPVVALNAPHFRRDVHHGGRFWDQVPGIQVDRPSELADAIAHALLDPPVLREMRHRSMDYWYAYTDGHAAERAAAAIGALRF